MIFCVNFKCLSCKNFASLLISSCFAPFPRNACCSYCGTLLGSSSSFRESCYSPVSRYPGLLLHRNLPLLHPSPVSSPLLLSSPSPISLPPSPLVSPHLPPSLLVFLHFLVSLLALLAHLVSPSSFGQLKARRKDNPQLNRCASSIEDIHDECIPPHSSIHSSCLLPPLSIHQFLIQQPDARENLNFF